MGDSAFSTAFHIRAIIEVWIKGETDIKEGSDWPHCYRSRYNWTYLQTSGLSISFIHHFKIHVELWRNSGVNGSLDTILDKTGKGRREIQVANGNAEFAFVQTLQDFGINFGKNRCSVGNQEAATTFSSFLEANKGSIGSSSLGSRLAMQANVVSSQGGLVDLHIEKENPNH